MHGSLSTHSRAETHGAGDKVGKDLVRRRRALGHVFLEAGDLQGGIGLLGATKGALKGRLGASIGGVSLLLDTGNSGASDVRRQLLAGAGAQQGGRGRAELRHSCERAIQLHEARLRKKGRGRARDEGSKPSDDGGRRELEDFGGRGWPFRRRWSEPPAEKHPESNQPPVIGRSLLSFSPTHF